MNPETKFRKKVCGLIDKLPNSFGFSIQQLAIVGTPDKFYCINGWAVVPELKASEDAHRHPMQIYNLNRINKAGGFGFFLFPENWDMAYNFMKFLSSEKGRLHDHTKLRAIAGPHVLPGHFKTSACDID